MEDLRYERICSCALGRIFGYEPKYAIALIQSFGSAAEVFRLAAEDDFPLMGAFSKYKGRLNPGAVKEAEKELGRLEDMGCRYIAFTEDCYPPLLKDCCDAPPGLYVRSSSPPGEVFGRKDFIAVVGTRDISPYGRECTRRIVENLTGAAPTIVSGLAIGVDICAHNTALDLGIPTVAVLPCGIDSVYPQSHRKAAKRIESSPGSALVTDYPPDTFPAAHTFIRRNRIIAGLAQKTILVESKTKGGGLITCRLAASYGREVFAVPGRVDDWRSAGCNALIRRGEAEAVTDFGNLGEQLGLGHLEPPCRAGLMEAVEARYASLPVPCERSSLMETVRIIRDNNGISLDEICFTTGKPYNEVSRLAATLESDKFIVIDIMGRCLLSDRYSKS